MRLTPGSIWQHRSRGHVNRVEYLTRKGRKTLVAFAAPAQGAQIRCTTLPLDHFLKTYQELK